MLSTILNNIQHYTLSSFFSLFHSKNSYLVWVSPVIFFFYSEKSFFLFCVILSPLCVMVSRLIALVIVLTLHIHKFPGSAGKEDHIFFKNMHPLKPYLLALLSEPVLHNTSYGSYKALLKSLCPSQLSQMEGRTDRTTFQTTWLGPFAKWHPTARFISGSSVLFTLFNCLTVPVYAVSLPILAASINRPSFPPSK